MQQFSSVCTIINHVHRNDVKMLFFTITLKVLMTISFEVSRRIVHARKRKTNFTIIASFPWPSVFLLNITLSQSACKKLLTDSKTSQGQLLQAILQQQKQIKHAYIQPRKNTFAILYLSLLTFPFSPNKLCCEQQKLYIIPG